MWQFGIFTKASLALKASIGAGFTIFVIFSLYRVFNGNFRAFFTGAGVKFYAVSYRGDLERKMGFKTILNIIRWISWHRNANSTNIVHRKFGCVNINKN